MALPPMSDLPTGPLHPEPDLPARIGRFRVSALLGSGGQGDVYRAYDPELDRSVVIKWARTTLQPEQQHSLRTEARLLARFEDDPGVVRVYHVDVEQDRPYVVCAFVEGETLADRLRRERLTPPQAAALIAEAAGILERIHRKGALHRDLKPANLLIDTAGRIRLLDFGLASLEQSWQAIDPLRPGTVSGTLPYLSPEQARGDTQRFGPPTDIFGLGAVLYHLLTQHPPYQGESTTELLQQARACQPTPPHACTPGVPPELDRICCKALAAEPENRYPSAAALQQDLERYLARPRRRKQAALVTAAVLLLLVGGSFYLRPRGAVPRPEAAPAATPLEPTLTVTVFKKNEPGRRRSLSERGVLPLEAQDALELDIVVVRPAWLYLFWIDAAGKVAPLYPWENNDWEARPTGETALPELHWPPRANAWGSLSAGPSGMETLMVFAREAPLPPTTDLSILRSGFPPQRTTNLLQPWWFRNGVLLSRDPERGAPLVVDRPEDVPAFQTQRRLERLRDLFPANTAVSVPFRGSP